MLKKKILYIFLFSIYLYPEYINRIFLDPERCAVEKAKLNEHKIYHCFVIDLSTLKPARAH